MDRIRVLLAEDHVIVREGLRAILEVSDKFEVVGEASTGREAVEMAKTRLPDVVIMDIAMPSLNGFEATLQILADTPSAKVLALSAYSDDEYVKQMIAVGAYGFLVKQNSGEALIHAIKEIAAGRFYFNPSILKRLRESNLKARESAPPKVKPKRPLTPRETETLKRLSEGYSDEQLAAECGIRATSAQKRRRRLMEKLGISDTAGLTRYAIATGVIASRGQATRH